VISLNHFKGKKRKIERTGFNAWSEPGRFGGSTKIRKGNKESSRKQKKRGRKPRMVSRKDAGPDRQRHQVVPFVKNREKDWCAQGRGKGTRGLKKEDSLWGEGVSLGAGLERLAGIRQKYKGHVVTLVNGGRSTEPGRRKRTGKGSLWAKD